MTNGLQKYYFLYDNNTFLVSSISGLRDFNKYTMDPSSRTRAGSLQSLIKVVDGLSGFELYYNEGSMNAFIVEINFDIVVIYKLKY